MKKLLNDPYAYAAETLDGLCRAHPQYYRFSDESRQVIVRPDSSVSGKVGVVTGGGSGHLPVFVGYVGQGLLNACAVGDVFASPSADDMAIAMRAADGGAGVLRLYGNYGGDVMNFDMAGELVELDGIASSTVLVADDIASASRAERTKRRGVAGHGLLLQDRRRRRRRRERSRRGHARLPRRPPTPATRSASRSAPASCRRPESRRSPCR